MGFFYTNITLKGPTQEQVLAYLRQERRQAYVSPTVAGVTVVYDRRCEDQDDTLRVLTCDLSRTYLCPALGALLHDDDVFWYVLYDQGEYIDEYDSEPGYFGYEGGQPPLPSGGDASKLCRAFGVGGGRITFAVDDVTQRVARLLHVRKGMIDMDGQPGLSAEERHQALAKALGLPPYSYSMGYYSIGVGNVPEGVAIPNLASTEW
jgi:hypothetical protein